jgi:adenylate kinase family enzyme
VRRVVVLGVSGAGKTTFAAALAEQLRMTHIELDALHWEANWVMAELDVFRARVAHAVAADAWVADGNYSKARDLVWTRADTVVWLDYSFALTFARLVRRTVARVTTGEELYSGNRERFKEQFLSRDSLFLWAIKSYRKHRASYPELFASEPYRHLQVVRLRSPRAAERWLREVPRPAG